MAKRKKRRFNDSKIPTERTIKTKAWRKYTDSLRMLSDKASAELEKYLFAGHTEEETLEVAHALVTKYGEASSELACQMYEALAEYSGAAVAAAEAAATATYGETARAIRGEMLRTRDAKTISSAAGRLVKLASVDTMTKNALRDGAEWAWIPSGDTCPYCLMLASKGWQRASDKIIKNGHATHIHNNCDCTFAVRLSDDIDVEGYDPDALYDEYINAGDTQWERINTLRRRKYAENKEYINAQKRAAYAKRKVAMMTERYSKDFDSFITKQNLTHDELKSIESADKSITDFYKKSFPGYKPAELLTNKPSGSEFQIIPNNKLSYKIKRNVYNTALPSKDDHVDIGNDALANSIHERTHDLINCLAMKRAGITDEENVSLLQREIFISEKNKIIENAFISCFNDESAEEIYAIIEQEISTRATDYGELIPESAVSSIGLGDNALANSVYDYLRKEWNRK